MTALSNTARDIDLPPTHRRHTIGLLLNSLQLSVNREARVWNGVADEAAQQEVDAMVFPIGNIDTPERFAASQTSVLCDFLHESRLDGLLTFQWWDSQEWLNEFRRRYFQGPLTVLGLSIQGHHSVAADHALNMRQAMQHLLDTHGYRKIAYFPGLDIIPATSIRQRMYYAVLAERGIPHDPALDVPSFTRESAESSDWFPLGVRVLFEERGLVPGRDVEAIVVQHDYLAFRVMRELQALGIRVPDDVAVLSFDNAFQAEFMSPPLTTIDIDWYEVGRQGVRHLLAMIRGEAVNPIEVNPARLHIRRSCGCFDLDLSKVFDVKPQAAPNAFETARDSLRESLPSALKQAFAEPGLEELPDWPRDLLEAILTALENDDPQAMNRVLTACEQPLYAVARAGGRVESGYELCSLLYSHLLPLLSADEARSSRLHRLLEQTRMLVGKIVLWAKAHRQAQADRLSDELRSIGQRLISRFDFGGLLDALAEGLPRLGIPAAFLSLYRDPKHPAGGCRLVLAYCHGERIKLPAEGRHFPSAWLLPDDIFPREQQTSLVVEALAFGEEKLGIIVFERGPRDASVYDILGSEISSALQGALLVRQVQDHAAEIDRRNAEIARQKYILDTFMENLPDPIYFKDREGRFTLVNPALASLVNKHDPGALLGKTDFDFYPHAQAALRHEQEQNIISSGQPLVSHEEPGSDGSWALTTKMPLRDEHGAIIGTFGISRDISGLKQTQSSLEQAYEELFSLNANLKEANLRYYLKASLLSMPFESSAFGSAAIDHGQWNAPLWNVLLLKLLLAPLADGTEQPVSQEIMEHVRDVCARYIDEQQISAQFNRILDTEAALIVNAGTRDDMQAFCSHIASQSQAFFEQHNAMLVLGVGRSVTAPEDLHRSYDSAQQALLSRRNSAAVQIVTAEDAEREQHEALMFVFPEESERQLSAAVLTGDTAKTLRLLHDMLEQNELENASYLKLTAVYQRCLRSTGKILAQHPLPESEAQGTSLLQIFHATPPETLPELQPRLNEVFQRLARAYAQQYQRRHDGLIQQLLRHLEKQYADPMLSLQSMADAFSLTPRYISSYFKTHAGVKYTEYLATLRIAKAKELLVSQPQQTLSDISAQVGFVNSETFIRVFKRLEKITPGAYRKRSHPGL